MKSLPVPPPGPASPCKPAGDVPWDLSPWGRVEARVSNPGDWRDQPWNSENVYLRPGETKTLMVVFGYQYGFQPGYSLDPSRVSTLKVFLNGKFTYSGASASSADGVHAVAVVPGKRGAVKLQPESGFWNLGSFTDVRVAVRNRGDAPVTLAVRIDSQGGSTDEISATLRPDDTIHFEVPFQPGLPWAGEFDHEAGKGRARPGTGTTYASCRTTAVTIIAPESPEQRVFEIVEARVEPFPRNARLNRRFRRPPGLPATLRNKVESTEVFSI